MIMTACPGHHLHQFGGGAEEVVELLGAFVNLQALAQMGLLGGNTHGAVVGVAGPHPQATDCLDSRVRYRNGIGTLITQKHKCCADRRLIQRNQNIAAGIHALGHLHDPPRVVVEAPSLGEPLWVVFPKDRWDNADNQLDAAVAFVGRA